MSMDTYHLSKQGCCTNQTNIFIWIKTIQPTMRARANSPAALALSLSLARALSSFAQPQSKCLLSLMSITFTMFTKSYSYSCVWKLINFFSS
jgi:hypothetical protein